MLELWLRAGKGNFFVYREDGEQRKVYSIGSLADARMFYIEPTLYDLPGQEDDTIIHFESFVGPNMSNCDDVDSGASDTKTLYRFTTYACVKSSQGFCTT